VRILLTGGSGQLGHELAPRLERLGTLTVTGRASLDLEDEAAIRRTVRQVRPELIVNAAAWTAVDRAESEPERAAAVNHRAPAVMAEEARALGTALIHFSTDYVFDGSGGQPWTEEDATGPLNVYGRTKLAGEEAIRAAGVPHLILRLSWVYGKRGRNFLLTLMRLLRERPEVAVVDDQHGSPTWCRSIAHATSLILDRVLDTAAAPAHAMARVAGTYHLTGPGHASWYDFAAAIRQAMENRGEAVGTLCRTSTSEYRTPAARPRNSRLSSRRARERFGVELPSWEAQLAECLGERGPQPPRAPSSS
jgi:dTDP-4-dehydrorhamnose reductase